MSFNESKKIFLALKEFEADITNMVTEMGNIAYNMTLETFRNQGFTDSTLESWEPRKRESRGRKRGILIGEGSGTTGLRGSYRKVRRGLLSISIVNNKIYASIHNEGGQIQKRARTFDVGFRKKRGSDQFVFAKIGAKKRGAKIIQTFTSSAHVINMPERRMIGDSAVMNKKIRNKLNFRIKKIWRN